ncbi:MAG: ATP-dependent helicase [Butyricicoccus pullicaecorum]
MEQNYRSTNTILDAANGLIRNNVNRKGKELWTKQEGGSKIKTASLGYTGKRSTVRIAARILEGVAKGCKWSDFAILYRNNVLSNAVESAFRRNSIPYRIYKGRDFFSRAEIRDMFAYLWVIENPSDTLRLKRIINVPARKIGARSVEIAEELAAQHNTMLYDIVSHADAYSELGRGAAAMKRFGDMMQELRDMQQTASLSELYDTMLDLSGYQEALENKNDMESRSRLENIMELKSNIVEYENKAEDPSLAGFLEEMALYTDADQDENEDDTVLMMTMHSAKGLEFPTVFLCGMEDGLFPSFRADESDEDLEEERRLCYVAITRAKQQLYLTCAERHDVRSNQIRASVPLLQEIPAELLDSNLTERARQAEAEQAQKSISSALTVNQSYRSASALQSSMAASAVPTLHAVIA